MHILILFFLIVYIYFFFLALMIFLFYRGWVKRKQDILKMIKKIFKKIYGQKRNQAYC